MVMFVMMNLLVFGGSAISQERQSGMIKRLAVYPLKKWQLVLGKVYGRFLLGMVQVLFFLLMGKWLFGVNIGQTFPLIL
jgi:ABC-type multidrug transport system permease subunit